MASGTVSTSNSISVISGANLLAEALVGNNGAVPGQAEYDLQDGANTVGQRRVWDTNVSDGFDSKLVSIQFSAYYGGSGGTTWGVGGSNVSLGATSYFQYVTQVKVRAAVQIAALMQWTSLAIYFLRGYATADSLVRQLPLAADTRSSAEVTQEQILTVTPSVSNADGLLIQAQIQLLCPNPGLPAPRDIFGQIFSFGAGGGG